jgi:hypothetical protein|tara:strand:- start:727 stop:903 length:177 start_codon:yes stop_codon:yes gene_type:complete
MEFFIVVAAGLAATFIVMAIHQIATEVRGMRSVLETHYQLERVPVRTENKYKRKGVEL